MNRFRSWDLSHSEASKFAAARGDRFNWEGYKWVADEAGLNHRFHFRATFWRLSVSVYLYSGLAVTRDVEDCSFPALADNLAQ
jgi:hypothetical protein